MQKMRDKYDQAVFALQGLALECPKCDGMGHNFETGSSMVCKSCEKLRELCTKFSHHGCISLSTPPGAKIRFVNALAGWDGDVRQAKNMLTLGQVYTVSALEVYDYSSTVWLEEFPGDRFNTVQFSNVGDVR